jgi:cobalt-precorrin 5A hydrolase/precorrin-3B C17-methyltransferase
MTALALVVLNSTGLVTARRIAPALAKAVIHGLAGRVDGAGETFAETAPALRSLFEAGHPIVGVCAAGILIRSLAPVLSDKNAEPPVIAVAADGSAVVPLLGGLTGGEELARRIAAALGVRPTSTAFGALETRSTTEGGGSLAIVGLGPGDPASLTPAAAEALAGATDLVGYTSYLNLVPERPHQHRHATDNREELARARHSLDLAREGRQVALVSSGDPGIFAMAGVVMEVLEREPGRGEGIAIDVLPGISAMQAAAARVGAPLGHDFAAISLSDNLKPWPVIERRLRAAAETDLVLALYNPAGLERREGIERAKTLLLGFRSADTPVVEARDVGRPGEQVTVTSLGAFDTAAVDMRTLVIVGSSQTRVLALPDGRRFVYSPRRYPSPDR